MKKNIIIPLILSVTLASGCSSNGTSSSSSVPPTSSSTGTSVAPVSLDDRDFDGLKNEIDPDPDSNQYTYHYVNWDGEEVVKDDTVTIDYREFLRNDLTTKYNSNLARFATMMLMETNGFKLSFKSNEYKPHPDTEISRLLTQIGCENIIRTQMKADQFSYDVLDLVNFYAGHHVVDDGTQKLNVFIVEMKGYDDNREWVSNFDLACDTPSYYATTGEHPDWTDKKAHKGFQVAANRATALLKEYITNNTIEGVNNLVFLSGHSRSAATGSIVAKNLTDSHINCLAYMFNTPTHFSGLSLEEAKSYTNIWQILNNEDIVSSLPIYEWDFMQIGHIVRYKFSEHTDVYNSIVKTKTFPSIDGDIVRIVSDSFYKILTERNQLYEYRPADPNVPEVILSIGDRPFNSEERAKEEIDDLYDAFNNTEHMKKIIKMEVGPYSKDQTKFQINFKTMPQLIIELISDIICNGKDTLSILSILRSYTPFMKRYIVNIQEAIDFMLSDFANVISFISSSHEPLGTFVVPVFINDSNVIY